MSLPNTTLIIMPHMVSDPIPPLSCPGLLHPSHCVFFLVGSQCIGNNVLCLNILRDSIFGVIS